MGRMSMVRWDCILATTNNGSYEFTRRIDFSLPSNKIGMSFTSFS
eukprot:Nitzschia sp. Nitz4//scaffold29_size155292//125177//125498//NITZ4_002684-RA/size155292-exonerate_est2genome-gene-0.112-mRNA-1//1//CDS//3329546526//1837//frame0